MILCRYWRYNEDMRTMDPGYPKPITIWKGIPDSPQGAFVDKVNGTTATFIKDQHPNKVITATNVSFVDDVRTTHSLVVYLC